MPQKGMTHGTATVLRFYQLSTSEPGRRDRQGPAHRHRDLHRPGQHPCQDRQKTAGAGISGPGGTAPVRQPGGRHPGGPRRERMVYRHLFSPVFGEPVVPEGAGILPREKGSGPGPGRIGGRRAGGQLPGTAAVHRGRSWKHGGSGASGGQPQRRRLEEKA